MVLLHDGSFEGLMTSIYKSYYSSIKPEKIFIVDDYVNTLLDETKMVFNDSVLASKVVEGITKKLGKEVLRHIFYVYYSEDVEASNVILNFLKIAFKSNKDILNFRAHKDVGPFLDLYNSVARESHRMLGLIRFVELKSGILLSQFETDYNLLAILSAHFFQRLTKEKWILHDVKRGLASVCRGDNWEIVELEFEGEISISENENFYQNLWKTYYENIAIIERINPKLQMQMMPKKYWKYLVEKNDVLQS